MVIFFRMLLWLVGFGLSRMVITVGLMHFVRVKLYGQPAFLLFESNGETALAANDFTHHLDSHDASSGLREAQALRLVGVVGGGVLAPVAGVVAATGPY